MWGIPSVLFFSLFPLKNNNVYLQNKRPKDMQIPFLEHPYEWLFKEIQIVLQSQQQGIKRKGAAQRILENHMEQLTLC